MMDFRVFQSLFDTLATYEHQISQRQTNILCDFIHLKTYIRNRKPILNSELKICRHPTFSILSQAILGF